MSEVLLLEDDDHKPSSTIPPLLSLSEVDDRQLSRTILLSTIRIWATGDLPPYRTTTQAVLPEVDLVPSSRTVEVSVIVFPLKIDEGKLHPILSQAHILLILEFETPRSPMVNDWRPRGRSRRPTEMNRRVLLHLPEEVDLELLSPMIIRIKMSDHPLTCLSDTPRKSLEADRGKNSIHQLLLISKANEVIEEVHKVHLWVFELDNRLYMDPPSRPRCLMMPIPLNDRDLWAQQRLWKMLL